MNSSIIFLFIVGGIVVISGGTTLFFINNASSPVSFNSSVVLYLPMISSSSNSTYTKDWSANNFNATLNNVTYIPISTKQNNLSYGYYSFNGVNSYFNYSDILDMGLNNWTISAWFYLNNYSVTNIAGKTRYASYGGRNTLSVLAGGIVAAIFQANSTGTTTFTISSNVVSLNTWHHGVVVFNRLGNMSLYVDNILVNSINISNVSSVNVDYVGPFDIGIYRDASGNPANYMNGYISQVMVLNQSLNSTQVSDLYNSQKDIFSAYVFNTNNLVKSQPSFYLSNSLSSIESSDIVLNLPMNNLTSNNTFTKDYSLYQNNGTGISVTYNASNNSYSFNGVNANINITKIKLSDNFSVSAWFNTNTLTSNRAVIGDMNSAGTDEQIEIMITNTGSLRSYYYVSSTLYGQLYYPISNTNTWYHAVYSKNLTDCNLYLNGVLVNTTACTHSQSTNSGNFHIGKQGDYPDRYWNGSISNILIFNRSLSDSEVNQLYIQGRQRLNYVGTASLINITTSPTRIFAKSGVMNYSWNNDGFYVLNDSYKTLDLRMKSISSNSTFTKDYSIYNYNSGVYNATYNASDLSYSFNGVNASLSPNQNLSFFISKSSGSICLWVKTTGTSPIGTNKYDGQIIVEDKDSLDANYAYISITRLNVSGTDAIWLQNWVGGYTALGLNYTNNYWNHICWIHGNNLLYGYINGVFSGSTASVNTTFLGGTLYFGKQTNPGNYYFNGSISNILIFNRSLSASEVQSIYNAGRR